MKMRKGKFREKKDEFERLYLSDVTWQRICSILDIAMGTVSRWRKKLGLPYRDATKIRRR